MAGMAYGAAAPWQSDHMDRTNFFYDYARLMYPAATAPDLASALSNMTIPEMDVEKLLGEQSMFALWEDPSSRPTKRNSRVIRKTSTNPHA